jgi:FlaA1/EpsC-like NDP-sugar epimerase
MLDCAESPLHDAVLELQTPACSRLSPELGDVGDETRIREIFRKYAPEVVFHAAALKHVPMLEKHPREAVRVNVTGTQVVAEEAARSGVEAFVMISTDKAVNPVSVMGMTKNVAERIVKALNRPGGSSRFVSVRFGNVLGSSGSVIPIFKKQIAKGGPVQVTHPEMKRYFMTVMEAVQLVLQASVLGQSGEVFLLDMGEPVKIVDLAEELIRLAGLVPNVDIKIEFTGIRPGEKLFEELSLDSEVVARTDHPRLYLLRNPGFRDPDPEVIRSLQLGAAQGIADQEIVSSLKQLVGGGVPQAAVSLARKSE